MLLRIIKEFENVLVRQTYLGLQRCLGKNIVQFTVYIINNRIKKLICQHFLVFIDCF